MALINFTDKVDLTVKDVPAENKIIATDINSLKAGVNLNETNIISLTAGQTGGLISFVDKATMDAFVPADLLGSYKVTNDSTSSNNGYYHWTGSLPYVKDADLSNGVVIGGNTDAVSGGTVFDNVSKFESSLTPWDANFNLTPQTISSGDKTIQIQAGSLFTNAEAVTKSAGGTFVIPDGSFLVYDFDSNIISVVSGAGYVTSANKYILFIHYNQRLISSIPLYNSKLFEFYYPSEIVLERNVIPETISTLIPWRETPTLTPFIDVAGTKTITISAGSLFSSTTSKNCNQATNLDLVIPDGSLAYLNWDDKTDGGSLAAGSFVIEAVSAFTSAFDKHILFINYDGKLKSPVPAYQAYLSRLYNSTDNVVYVSKNGEGFNTITSAVDYVTSLASSGNPYTIMVMPGTYLESVRLFGFKDYISVIGLNKKDCIIQTNSGQSSNPPLEVGSNALIKNLTLIHTHIDDNTTPVDQLRGYGIHADWGDAGETTIEDCIVISYQNSAIGIGLHTDQTIKVINCELYSFTEAASTMTVNGALFCHSNSTPGQTNQNLIVRNSIIKSNLSYATYLEDSGSGSGCEMAFYNNMFYSNQLGKTSIVNVDALITGNLSGNIDLTQDSYGNNISELNA
tara:strand:- start:5 stop:1882 length:1878 start_codon:yes stop_codon:yes gene_type:complete